MIFVKELADFIICRSCLLQRQSQAQYFFHRKKHYKTPSTHYDVLGIKNSASPEEIREAFVNLSKMHHPDKTDHDDSSKFVRIHKAYTVLSKVASRREYDFSMNEAIRRQLMMQSMMRSHHHGNQPTPGSGSADSSSEHDAQVFWDESIYSMRDKSKDHLHQNAPYYGFTGFQKMSNAYIVLGCCLVIMLGAAVHILVINTSSRRTRRKLDERDKKLHGMYKESKQKARDHGNALQLHLLTSKVAEKKRLAADARKGVPVD